MTKTVSHVVVGALCMALGLAVGMLFAKASRDATIPADAIDDIEIKEIAINRLLEVLEGGRSDVTFAFQSIDRRKDGTIVVVGLMKFPLNSKAKAGVELGQPPKRFWVELIPDGGSKKWKDMPVGLEYKP
ncbi:MAG: hypothetical protein WD768_19695 [Phycisphaeraceae bacterium]